MIIVEASMAAFILLKILLINQWGTKVTNAESIIYSSSSTGIVCGDGGQVYFANSIRYCAFLCMTLQCGFYRYEENQCTIERPGDASTNNTRKFGTYVLPQPGPEKEIAAGKDVYGTAYYSGYEIYKLVDGDKTSASAYYSAGTSLAYFVVDLGAVYNITSVTVYLPFDNVDWLGYWGYMEIRAGLDQSYGTFTDYKVLGAYSGYYATGAPTEVSFTAPADLCGRYVSFQRYESSITSPLVIYEVEIYGN